MNITNLAFISSWYSQYQSKYLQNVQILLSICLETRFPGSQLFACLILNFSGIWFFFVKKFLLTWKFLFLSRYNNYKKRILMSFDIIDINLVSHKMPPTLQICLFMYLHMLLSVRQHLYYGANTSWASSSSSNWRQLEKFVHEVNWRINH